MAELIKTIINELSKDPFKKKFTVISFDSLTPELLLQIFNDVLAETEPSNKIDIREEAIEDTVLRMLHMLRILKYRPPESDPSILRNGLLNGKPSVVHPILAWSLVRIPELKTRAYLARFLVKVDVPEEFRADIDVEELYQQYEGLIEEFKENHKQLESLKSKGFTTAEIRKDIQAMESEYESVMRKIERLKQRTQAAPELDLLLSTVKNFRKERESAKELGEQLQSQSQGLKMMEQRVERAQKQLKEVQQSLVGATPEGTLQRLREDTDVMSFIVKEKLPKEIVAQKRKVEVYEKILSESYDMGDLEEKQIEIEMLKKEVNEMVMKRMMKKEDDKLVMLRQQTAIITNKKMGLLEKLTESRAELASIKEDILEKREIVSKFQGSRTLNEEEFKEYVKNLRIKSTRYKQLKLQLNSLKSEGTVLENTKKILEAELKDSEMDLTATEARLGIQGYLSLHENMEKVTNEKSSLDEQKSRSLQEMTLAVQELKEKISEKKMSLAPLVKNLNGLRQAHQILSHEYETRKRTYDGIVTSVETGLSRIIKEVENQRKRYEDQQLNYALLVNQISLNKANLQLVKDELKLYASSGKNDGAVKSLKEKLIEKNNEQERLSKILKDEEKELIGKQGERVQQGQMWRDVLKILEWKNEWIRNGRPGGN